jgi:hypothetical protein
VRLDTADGALRSWVLSAADAAAWWTAPDLAILYFRPLVVLSFLWDRALWDLSPAGYHLTNLLLHAVTTLLFLAIARRLLASEFAARTGASLFAVHPCHTEAILWVSGRTDLMAGLCFALAIWLYLRGRAADRLRSGWFGLCLLACGLALAAKEMALTLPAVLLLHTLCFPDREPLRRRFVAPVLAAVVVLGYLVLRVSFVGGLGLPPHPFAHGPGDPDMLWNAFSGGIMYMADLVLFIPADPVVFQPFWRDHLPLLGLLALAAAGLLISSARSVCDRRLRIFALAAMAITLLPVLPISPGERFVYVPSIGYCLLIGARASAIRDGTSARAKRVAAPMVALILIVTVAKVLLFGAITHRSRLPIDDAMAALERTPRPTALLAIDLPAASALGFAHALRLARPGLQVEILSVAPHFLWLNPDFRSVVERPAADRVSIRAIGTPYLDSYIERAFLGERPALRPLERIERLGMTVEVVEAEGQHLRAFEVRLDERLAAGGVVMRGEGFHLMPLLVGKGPPASRSRSPW